MAKCAMKDCRNRAQNGSTLCASHAQIASMPSMNSGKKCKEAGCRMVPAAGSQYCKDHQKQGQQS